VSSVVQRSALRETAREVDVLVEAVTSPSESVRVLDVLVEAVTSPRESVRVLDVLVEAVIVTKKKSPSN
jgi:hypothetical protein